jgi:quercetin dioxygenase-like cupin family protein
MVSVSKHADIPGEVRGPGVTRKITVDKSTGPPHTHLVEEAMTLVEGKLKILVGTETDEIEAPVSWLAPANTVHGARNIGSGPATLIIAYPANEVAAVRVEVDF